MNAPESRSDRSDFPAITSHWFGGGVSMKLLIRWGAVLFCALFWLGVLLLVADPF
jgi:hypothetical protein